MKNLLLVPLLAVAFALLGPVSAQIVPKKVVHHYKRHHKKKVQAVKVTNQTTTNDPDSKIYLVEFPAKQSATDVEAFLLGKEYSVTFLVKVSYGHSLQASINEMADRGNININKIILPDGTGYGPFSRQMEYLLAKPGTYKVVVGCEDKGGDDWKGVFTLHIAVQ